MPFDDPPPPPPRLLCRYRQVLGLFILGLVLSASVPTVAHQGSVLLFVLFFCIILSMYGGGFATVPAYLADMFGTHMVGAIHGRLLTAWATAGVLGPVLVNYLREFQLAAGIPREAAYDQTMYIMAGLLVLGLVCNLLVRAVAERHYMTDADVARLRKTSAAAVAARESGVHADFEDFLEEGKAGAAGGVRRDPSVAGMGSASLVVVGLAWAAVGLPLLWGVWITLQKAVVLFH